LDAFRASLRELGYVEGQNLVIELQFGAGRDDLLRDYTAEFIQHQVDVLFAVGSPALRAAQQVTRTTPIVALDLESDPVTRGFITSLARPGGNITGVFLDLPEFNGKRLELLKEAIPELSRVAVLWEAATDPSPVAALEVATQSLGLQLQLLPVHHPDDFGRALGAASRGDAQGLVVLQTPLMSRYGAQIVALTTQYRLPTMAMFSEFAVMGGLMSYGPNLNELFRRVGIYVGKILKGAKPADLPVERPTKFELVINLKTAKALGLTIPPTLLFQADEVIR
jgi:putative ABC transport system substrate-binding protein